MSNILDRHMVIILTLILSGTLALPAMSQTQSDQSATPVVEDIVLFTEVDLAPVNLASTILDADAYTPSGEKLGEVSDILLDGNNRAIGVVVGVGGFLGIDETNVAIPINKISITPEETDGRPILEQRLYSVSITYKETDLRVVADVTKEEVQAAAQAK